MEAQNYKPPAEAQALKAATTDFSLSVNVSLRARQLVLSVDSAFEPGVASSFNFIVKASLLGTY